LLGQIFRQREGHLSCSHTPILPYKVAARCHHAERSNTARRKGRKLACVQRDVFPSRSRCG
jgi:hypothetical protein